MYFSLARSIFRWCFKFDARPVSPPMTNSKLLQITYSTKNKFLLTGLKNKNAWTILKISNFLISESNLNLELGKLVVCFWASEIEFGKTLLNQQELSILLDVSNGILNSCICFQWQHSARFHNLSNWHSARNSKLFTIITFTISHTMSRSLFCQNFPKHDIGDCNKCF